MNVIVNLDQINRVKSKGKKMEITINESQLEIIRKSIIDEETVIFPESQEVTDETYEVKLKDVDNLSDVLIVSKKTNDPNEPSLESLIGKKRFDIVPLTINGEEKNYKIFNIYGLITKSKHETYDDVSKIQDLIDKLKRDPFFQKNKYKIAKEDFDLLEELKSKGSKVDREVIQIYYLLFRRSGSLKKFLTKLSNFIPFMRMLLSKGEPLFSCITEKIEKALELSNDKTLSDFSLNPSNFKRLSEYISNLQTCDSNLKFDFESFFKTADYAKYEKGFVGTHFEHSPTSVSMDLELKSDLDGLKASEFNSLNNLNKMAKILKWILSNKIKSGFSEDELVDYIVDELEISFPDKTKRDLKVIKPITKKSNQENISPILQVGDSVEVKYKDYSKSDFLCEFFKPEAHNATMEFLINQLMSVDENINSSNEVLYHIGKLDTAIVNKITGSELGQSVIDKIKSTTAGIIFKDYVYIKMNDIDLSWTNVGYGGKPRIAIKYSVKKDAKKYLLNIDNSDKQQINGIFYND